MTRPFGMLEAQAEMRSATDCLTKTDLIVLRSYATPPGIVIKVLNAVQVVLGHSSPQSWESVRRGILSNIQAFIHRLRTFPADAVSLDTLARLHKVMTDKDLHPGHISRVHKGLSLVIVWLRAVYKYGLFLHSTNGR